MKNIYINNLNEKDVDHFTTDTGLKIRKTIDKPFKKLCNIFTNANIIRLNQGKSMTDEEYYTSLSTDRIPLDNYDLASNKNNIILERYPELAKDESYIFVCNHTCPEDIETVLNIIDRNAYLVLGSVESLKYNPEIYLSWLNGMIPFDIVNQQEREELIPKMERVLKTNSILIFPEGSHNYHPNKIINNLFDGPVNLALQTHKKIVVITLVKDDENNVSYIDVSNPIDVEKVTINDNDYYPYMEASMKKHVKSLSAFIRDKMATAVYYMYLRHFDSIVRNDYKDIDSYFRNKYIEEAFSKLKWEHDVFAAEYLVKKTTEEREYEDIIATISNLQLSPQTLKNMSLVTRDYILKEEDIKNKDVADYMRTYWLEKKKDIKELTLK